MHRLYVMRHAKSSWAVPGARDFDRELNERGHTDLTKISRILIANTYMPELVLCSAATRTRQTFNGIVDALNPEPKITFTDKLYSGGVDDYISLLQGITGAKSIMIIGHNPMCGALAASLAKNGKDEHLETISYKYPTGTVAVLDFDIAEWSQLEKGSGSLNDLLVPSTL